MAHHLQGEMQVPSWSHSCPLHSDQSSEDDQGCVPASQSSSPSKSNGLLLHGGNQNICKGDPRKDGAALFEVLASCTLKCLCQFQFHRIFIFTVDVRVYLLYQWHGIYSYRNGQ